MYRVVPKVTDFGLSQRIEPENLSDPNRYPHNPLDYLMAKDNRYAPVRDSFRIVPVKLSILLMLVLTL